MKDGHQKWSKAVESFRPQSSKEKSLETLWLALQTMKANYYDCRSVFKQEFNGIRRWEMQWLASKLNRVSVAWRMTQKCFWNWIFIALAVNGSSWKELVFSIILPSRYFTELTRRFFWMLHIIIYKSVDRTIHYPTVFWVLFRFPLYFLDG